MFVDFTELVLSSDLKHDLLSMDLPAEDVHEDMNVEERCFINKKPGPAQLQETFLRFWQRSWTL